MNNFELTAEVFRIIRANADKDPKQIMKLLRDALPDVTNDELKQAIVSLTES